MPVENACGTIARFRSHVSAAIRRACVKPPQRGEVGLHDVEARALDPLAEGEDGGLVLGRGDAQRASARRARA